MAYPHGELPTSVACVGQGAALVLSCQSIQPPEDVAQRMLDDADRSALWFQLNLLSDQACVRHLWWHLSLKRLC